MKKATILLATVLLARPALCRGQASGNVGYSESGGRARAEQNERAKRTVARDEQPPSGTSTFVDANVLINVPADQYVAVFGIAHEGVTLADCGRKMDDTIERLTDELKGLGIAGKDLFVDFVGQNRIYGFEVAGNVAREKVVGFELKKNISVHYKEKSLLDKLILAAARSEVFDLIKVDYVVTDTERVRDQLTEEAGRVIKRKASRYATLLDIKLRPPGQVFSERFASYSPAAMYDSYTAFEGEQVGGGVGRERLTTQSARKSRTFFFNALDPNGFDAAINPVVTEPVVQFTLYLKVKYEVEPPKAK